jgi:serine protease Do
MSKEVEMLGQVKRIALLAAAIIVVSTIYVYRGDAPLPPAHAVATLPAPTVARHIGLPDFTAIVERYGPAVVNISTSGTMKQSVALQDDAGPFELFHRFGIPAPTPEVRVHGLGSGLIIGTDGLILTNAHVIDGSKEIVVRLSDKREFPATVLGVDKATDIAVLRIAAAGLPIVQTGDPSRTRVGEWVLAIGSPFGFEQTATAGIVSAKSRSLPDGDYVPFLQTDVAVNPGNSGGPLFNLDGQVIGINSQILSRSGGYEGLSFAIPIDVAIKVKDQIVAQGKVSRGRLGVTIQSVDQALADSFRLPRPEGALVSSVVPDSPAARAGLAVGDVIMKLNGQDIASSADLPPKVGDLLPGSVAHLDVWREGQSRNVAVTVGHSDSGGIVAGADTGLPLRLGLTLRPLTRGEHLRLGMDGGLLVEDVADPAASAGIAAGDLIVAANGTPVASVDQLRTLVAKAGKHVALLIQRGEDRLFIPIDPA